MVQPKAEQVILVDSKDNPIGVAEKLEAHKRGQRHRAFSIFIFNSKTELLLQKRSNTKYHSPNLWSNTVCGHPRPGEQILLAATRRLKEELGFTTDLKKISVFPYKLKLDNNLVENEIDHIFIGSFDGSPKPNPHEVSGWRWVDMEKLIALLEVYPQRYSPWLRAMLELCIANNSIDLGGHKEVVI